MGTQDYDEMLQYTEYLLSAAQRRAPNIMTDVSSSGQEIYLLLREIKRGKNYADGCLSSLWQRMGSRWDSQSHTFIGNLSTYDYLTVLLFAWCYYIQMDSSYKRQNMEDIVERELKPFLENN